MVLSKKSEIGGDFTKKTGPKVVLCFNLESSYVGVKSSFMLSYGGF